MKAHLLHRDRDFDLGRDLPWNADALTRDLALDTLFEAMAANDEFVLGVVRKVVLGSLENDPETIRYRQDILRDCLQQASVVRALYALTVEAMEKERKHYLFGALSRYPDYALRHAIDVLQEFVAFLKQLRRLSDASASAFQSEGWRTLLAVLRAELSPDYFARIQHHLEQLRFRHGVLLSARLGKGNTGRAYTLHVQGPPLRGWAWLKQLIADWLARSVPRRRLKRLWSSRQSDVFSFSLHPRDEAGAKALGHLQERGVAQVATALSQSADHVHSFFDMLRTELAFYVGCINLHERLSRKGEPVCFPVPSDPDERRLSFRGLYDICLSLRIEQRVVGNDATADAQRLVIITGANQGGKSTFLRSVGLAQLMMQAGLFVPADSFRASPRDGVFTHYKREEDTSMESGKLDEELGRMSAIVDHATPHSLVLFNESFAATNEREGSEIARQIVLALLEHRVKVLFVTHLYDLASTFHDRNKGDVLFLRAARERTFKLVEAEPLETSYGEDLYGQIFGPGVATADRERANHRVAASTPFTAVSMNDTGHLTGIT